MANEQSLVLAPQDLRLVREVIERHIPDRPVFAFGSRTRGHSRRLSDLDLAIGGDSPLPLDVSYDLKDEFAESDLRIMVDVVDLRSVDQGFRQRIEHDFVTVYLPEKKSA